MREREEVKGANVAVAPLLVGAAGAQEKKMHPLTGWDVCMYVRCQACNVEYTHGSNTSLSTYLLVDPFFV